MTYQFLRWNKEDIETEAKYWLSKASKLPIVKPMYDLMGGDDCPEFSVPATFVLTNLLFKELPSFLISQYVFDTEPNLYMTLFGVAMQVVASVPVALYKANLKKSMREDEDVEPFIRGPFQV